MKKRLSVLLAMTILATSLPVSSMRAAEMNRNAAVVCTDTTDGSLKDNDEMKSKDATEQIVQGEVVQKETGKTDEPASGETSAAKPEQSASGEMKQPTSGETEQPAPEGTEQPSPGETEQPTPGETVQPSPEETEQPTPGETEQPTPGETEQPTPDQTITEEPGRPAPEVTVPEVTEEQTPGEAEEGIISGYALMGTALWRIPSRAMVEEITVSDAAGMIDALNQVNSSLSGEGQTTYNIVLENDVDLSGADAWVGFGTNERPFQGSFNGNGHTVKLKDGSMPLFCYAKEATIKNVVVKSTGTIKWAGVVGHMYGGTIQNCGNLSNVTEISEYAGGVVAYARHAETGRLIISDCWNGGTITGKSYTGGVAGYIAQVSASNQMSVTGAVNFGTVKSSEPNSIAGGIVGGINSNVIVEDVYNGGIVSGKAAAAGIVGKITDHFNVIRYAINSGKVISDGDWNPICYYVGKESNDITQTLYDNTVNSGTYSIGSENKVNGTPTGKSTLDLIKLNESDKNWANKNGNPWRFYSGSDARYYPICMPATKEGATLSKEIANTASSAAFVKDGKDGKKYLCLLSDPDKYSYKGKKLEQFEEVTIEEATSPEEPYITYQDGEYTKKICLPEPGTMTVIYGLYNDDYEISISGTLDKVTPDNDGVYTLSYGEKVNMTLGLKNGQGEAVIVSDQNAWSNTIPFIGLEDKAETGADNTSVRMITGQITAAPSDTVYTLVLAVKVSTDGQDSWCLKKLKVKVKKADATFIWDNKFSDKKFDNKEYSINAVFREEKDFESMEHQPSVEVVYYKESTPLSGAPKDAGSYSVEMKSPETDAYYEYTVPEKAQFGIAPRQLTNDMVTPPSDLIVETKGQNTEQEITVYDKELNLTLIKDKDYTLEYADTQKPGTAIVKLEGKGNYFTEETIVKEYTIKELLTADMFTLPKSCVVIGMDKSTELPVTGTDKLTKEPLKQGYDYTVLYSGTDRMGQATVTITPGKNENYVEGKEPIVLHYDVKKLLTADMFRLENEDAVTLGTGKEHKKVIGEDKELEPAVTLKEGTDYVLSYSDTDKPGTATVTVLAAEKSNYVTDKKNPIEFRYTVMLGNSETNLDTGTYRLGNPGLWYLKEQPDVHYYAEIEFYVSSPIRYQFYLVEK